VRSHNQLFMTVSLCGIVSRIVEPSVSDVGVVNKAVAILSAVSAEPMGLAELSVATSLPRATVHRLAVALERHRLVARDADGRFELGPRVAELAKSGSTSRRALAQSAGPALAALRNATGESAQLYVPLGDARICVSGAFLVGGALEMLRLCPPFQRRSLRMSSISQPVPSSRRSSMSTAVNSIAAWTG